MKLRKPCEHGRYEEHQVYVSRPMLERTAEAWRASWNYEDCPGGVFLPDDTIVIEKVDGDWPWSVLEVIWTRSGGSAEGLMAGLDALIIDGETP